MKGSYVGPVVVPPGRGAEVPLRTILPGQANQILVRRGGVLEHFLVFPLMPKVSEHRDPELAEEKWPEESCLRGSFVFSVQAVAPCRDLDTAIGWDDRPTAAAADGDDHQDRVAGSVS